MSNRGAAPQLGAYMATRPHARRSARQALRTPGAPHARRSGRQPLRTAGRSARQGAPRAPHSLRAPLPLAAGPVTATPPTVRLPPRTTRYLPNSRSSAAGVASAAGTLMLFRYAPPSAMARLAADL